MSVPPSNASFAIRLASVKARCLRLAYDAAIQGDLSGLTDTSEALLSHAMCNAAELCDPSDGVENAWEATVELFRQYVQGELSWPDEHYPDPRSEEEREMVRLPNGIAVSRARARS